MANVLKCTKDTIHPKEWKLGSLFVHGLIAHGTIAYGTSCTRSHTPHAVSLTVSIERSTGLGEAVTVYEVVAHNLGDGAILCNALVVEESLHADGAFRHHVGKIVGCCFHNIVYWV